MSSINPKELKLLEIIVKNASASASRALSKWMRSSVNIQTDSVDVIPFESIAEKSGMQNDVSIGLYMNIEQGMSGSLLFMFDEPSAYQFLDIMINKELGTTNSLGDLEKSALLETANVIGCAYLNSIYTNTTAQVIPGPPLLLHDMTQSIIESIAMEQAAFQSESLFIKTDFQHDKANIDLNFFFLPIFTSVHEILTVNETEEVQG